MNTLVRTIPMLNASVACFTRIQAFLNTDARRDHRLPLSRPESSGSTISTTNIELQILVPLESERSRRSIIATQHASFGWEAAELPAVSDATFNLLRHQFCFVIGPIGSGKSTLLKGLLGETPSTQGFVYSDSPTTAFVDQTPWIQNGTIKQNILGISAYDEPWYEQVIRACALEFDISKLLRGHGKPTSMNSLHLH